MNDVKLSSVTVESGNELVSPKLNGYRLSISEEGSGILMKDKLNTNENKQQPLVKNSTTSSKKKKRRNKNRSGQAKSANPDSIDLSRLEINTLSRNTITDHQNSNNLNQKGSEPSVITTNDKYSYKIDEPPKKNSASPMTLSPRKQSIMRYRKSDDKINGGSFINEIKGNLKASKQLSNEGDEGNKYQILNNIDLDEKVTLFKYNSSKILIFHEQLNESLTKSTGRLLAHGEFEIFQLHNGKVTYLSCGKSFIYPLLPKLKILRISFNQFILPLLNPERYWKIFINSEESNVMGLLESTFQKVVSYRNLFFSNNTEKNKSDKETSDLQVKENTSISKDSSQSYHQNPYDLGFSDDCHTIPESPPSAPISPHQQNSVISIPNSSLPLKPGWSLSKNSPTPVRGYINSTVNNDGINNKLFNFRDNEEANHKLSIKKNLGFNETKSDSDDSLLDEYEERISTSQSMNFKNFAISRPISRSSSAIIKNYGQSNKYNTIHKSDSSDEFPATSLSEYNRARNKGLNISRKSSKSELYNSESNWMEPNIVYAKRNYAQSMSGYNKSRDLNETYKNIYSSISLRSINGYLEGENNIRNNRNSIYDHNNGISRNQGRNFGSSLGGKNINHTGYEQNPRLRQSQLFRGNDNTRLKSMDIYSYIKSGLVSSKSGIDNNIKKKNPGLASKVFGWF